MRVEFICPHCGARIRAVEGNGGDTAACSSCGRSVPCATSDPAVPSPASLPGRSKPFIPPPAIWGIVLSFGVPLLAVILAFLLPLIQMMRESARKEEGVENMEKIERALENSEEKTLEAEGQPVESPK